MSVDILQDSGAGIITMTDSSGGNRLNPNLIKELQDAVKIHTNDDKVRFILLRSNGHTFCLGMDLDAFIMGNGSDNGLHSSVMAYSSLLDRIHRCPKTIVSLIQGPVKAGGVGLVAATDVVVAVDTADFELSELYLGLIPANVMPYVLSMRMPVKRAAYLVQTAACIDAPTAQHWGLVDEVHPANNLEKAVKKIGRRLMRLSPTATARQKAFIRKLGFSSTEEQRNLAVKELVDIASGEGVLATVKNFTAGELPPWFEAFKPVGPLCWPN